MTLPIHKRTLIADKMIKILKEKTIAKKNVAYAYTPKPGMDQLPVVLIYAQSESIEELSQAPRELRRNLFMSVECIADGSTDEEMTIRLDTLADQVEQLLSADDSLGCTVDDIMLNSVDFNYEGDENEGPIGSCRMAYLIKYRELMPREQINVDEFTGIDVNWDINQDEIIDAVDKIDLNNDNE